MEKDCWWDLYFVNVTCEKHECPVTECPSPVISLKEAMREMVDIDDSVDSFDLVEPYGGR